MKRLALLLVLLSACGTDPAALLEEAGGDVPAALVSYNYEVRTSSTLSSFEIEAMTSTQSMDTGVQNSDGTGNGMGYFITGSSFSGQAERFSGGGNIQVLVFKDGVIVYNQSIFTSTGTVQWTDL